MSIDEKNRRMIDEEFVSKKIGKISLSNTEIEADQDDIVLAYLCSSCGEKTTEYRRLKHRTSVIREGKLVYEEPPRYLYKCPYCRGALSKIIP